MGGGQTRTDDFIKAIRPTTRRANYANIIIIIGSFVRGRYAPGTALDGWLASIPGSGFRHGKGGFCRGAPLGMPGWKNSGAERLEARQRARSCAGRAAQPPHGRRPTLRAAAA